MNFLLRIKVSYTPDCVCGLVGSSRTSKDALVQCTTTNVAGGGAQTGIYTHDITPPHA